MSSELPKTRGAADEVVAELARRVGEAGERLAGWVRHTELEGIAGPELGAGVAAHPIGFKMECWQETGSFKLRGATNKLLQLAPSDLERGVVASSSGNHGLAVACALRKLGRSGLVFAPESVSAAKATRLRALGVELSLVPGDCVEAEHAGRGYAREHDLCYVAPYNDVDVVAGQGTVGSELIEQMPEVDYVFVTVGGGGLIAGTAAAVKAVRPQTRIVGCLPAASPVMAESVRRGEVVAMESLPTLSDGSAGGIEPGALTLPLCSELVDEFVLVAETQIADAMVRLAKARRWLVEGAAGVALAGYLQVRERMRDQRVAIVLCGGNVALETFKRVWANGQGRRL